MNVTITTTEAARHAGVTTATVRLWCRYGAVTAAKRGGRWVIDAASLRHRVRLSMRPTPAVLRAFADPDGTYAKAVEIIEVGGVVPMDEHRYLAVSGDGHGGYVLDAAEGSCTCKGYVYTGRCYHAVAVAMMRMRTAARVSAFN